MRDSRLYAFRGFVKEAVLNVLPVRITYVSAACYVKILRREPLLAALACLMGLQISRREGGAPAGGGKPLEMSRAPSGFLDNALDLADELVRVKEVIRVSFFQRINRSCRHQNSLDWLSSLSTLLNF